MPWELSRWGTREENTFHYLLLIFFVFFKLSNYIPYSKINTQKRHNKGSWPWKRKLEDTGWCLYAFLFLLFTRISPAILKMTRMLRERLTNSLVSSFWYPLITPLVFSRLAPCQKWSVHMLQVGSDGQFWFLFQ